MRKLRYVVLSIAMALLVTGLSAQQASAAEITTEQVVNYQNLVSGVAVTDDGTIWAVAGSSVLGFKAGNNSASYSVSLPAKCGNLCASGDYLFAAGYMSGHMNDIYVINTGDRSCKTLDAGERAQAVAVDYDGYLYCVNSTATNSYGKKATKIMRAKISDVVSLSSGAAISWTKTYQPDYEAPSGTNICYPQSIAVDGRGYIYIADKGSSNGYDSAVNGIFKYDPATGSVTTMTFTAGSTQRLFTWVYDVCADDYGTVAVVGRNNYEIAIFEPGSTVADTIIKASGFPEGVGMDKEGNVYFNASNNSDTSKNGIFRSNMGHVAVTGVSLSSSKTVNVGESFTLSAEVSPSDATNKGVLYSSSDTSVATVSASGKVTGKKAGTATVTVKTVQGRKTASCTVTVKKVETPSADGTSGDTSGGGTSTVTTKKANPLKIAAKTATVKFSKLKKKAQTLKVTQIIKFKKDAKDKKTYTLSSAKKGTKSFKKYFKINKTTGKLTVKKGLKKGTYKVTVKVKAKGNSKYKASGTKKVTIKVKVK